MRTHDITAWLRRPAGWAWASALAIVSLYFVGLTAAGPWDPWETHYGEVARQILVRSDPVDLWWQPGDGGPQGGFEKSFASKPALPFWCMALAMRIFGVGTSADPAEMVRSPWPELALRLPGMCVGLLGVAVLGACVWRLVSPRAGIWSAVVLATMPQWVLVCRQALTDVYFVTPVIGAAVAWCLAWLQPDRRLRTRRWGRWEVPWDRAYAAFLGVLVVGAVIPLCVVHQHAFDPWSWEMFGQTAWKAKGLRAIQRHMFWYWGALVVLVALSGRWRRRSEACMGILYLAAGVSLMGKGIIGPGLVGAFVLGYLAIERRWELLTRCGLPTGVGWFALAGFPWHHAMIVYRGDRWIYELILQNNLQRFSTGEQDHAVGTLVFYWQTLGLAALPWSMLVPAALFAVGRAFWRHGREGAGIGGDGGAMFRFAAVWFGVSMFVLSYSTTKYYHYLVPCLPPLAVVVGCAVASGTLRRGGGRLGLALGSIVGIGVLRDVIAMPAWLAHLTTYLYTGMWTEGAGPTWKLGLTTLPFFAGLGLVAIGRGREARLAWVLSAGLTIGWLLADYVPTTSETWSQRSAMRIYFDRKGPSDRLVSWWFYYRGETFFSKRDVWVSQNPDGDALAELIEDTEAAGGTLWFVTIESHANRLGSHLPARYRDGLEEVYRSAHYVMLRLPLVPS